MAVKFKIVGLDETRPLDSAIKVAKTRIGNAYNASFESVLRAAFSHPDRMPQLRISKKKKEVPLEEYIDRIYNSYRTGYDSRPSVRTGNPSTTIPDEIIAAILPGLFRGADKAKIDSMISSHTRIMQIEILVGDMLEEYLSEKLQRHGWVCAWGSTVDAVDFVHSDGRMLQVKNSDNSENSSSSRVRNDTVIIKWFRRYSKKVRSFNWEQLTEITGVPDLSEENFQAWCIETIRNNPSIFHDTSENDPPPQLGLNFD